MTRPARKGKPPLGVQVQVLLRMLGLAGKRIEWDHVPALGLRPVDPETGDLDPPQNDPDHIQVLVVDEHAPKTKEDVKVIAKAKRQSGETGQQARRDRRKAAEAAGKAPPMWGGLEQQWPKGRKMQSRPMERRAKT